MDGPFLDSRIEVVQGNLLDVSTIAYPFKFLSLVTNQTGLFFIRSYLERISSTRDIGKSNYLNGCCRSCLFNLIALVIKHSPDPTWVDTCYIVIALTQRTAFNKHTSDDTPTLVNAAFDNLSLCAAVGVYLQLEHFSLQQYGIEQLLNSCLLQCGNLTVESRPTPGFGHQAKVTELLHYPIRICFRKVTFVYRNDDGNICSSCMVNSLTGLRHNAIICSNDKNDNISNLCSTGTHHGECGVSRSIEEYHFALTFESNLVCADMLGYSPKLTFSYLSGTNGIEQLGLTMVNVTHYRNDWCTIDHILVSLRFTSDKCLIIQGYKVDFTVVITTDNLSCLKVDLLVNRHHHTHLEQFGNNLTSLQIHLLGQIRDRDDFHHIYLLGNRSELGSCLLLSSLDLELFLFLSISLLVGSGISLLERFLRSSLVQFKLLSTIT